MGFSLTLAQTLAYFVLLLTSLHLCSTSSSFYTPEENLAVETSSGPITGFQFTQIGSVINAWRGIPFAAPPVGDRRWEASVPPESWSAPLACDTFKSMCVQPGGLGHEDCLYLNVYTNANASSPGPHPVLFYIYGGSLMGGNADMDFTRFAAQAGGGSGVVVVQANYRLNIFGFLATEELSTVSSSGTSGNYGILDQIRALQWVQDNIEGFGGDPNRVTIMGQSSGGTSVFALMSSPLADGLFHGAVSLSGSPNITMGIEQAHAQNRGIVAASGCSGAGIGSDKDVVACLKSIPAKKLVGLIPPSWETPGIWNLPTDPSGQGYAGLPVVDGQVIALPFGESLFQAVVDVPLLMGNTGQEPDIGPERDVSAFSLAEWKALLVSNFMPWGYGETMGQELYALYEEQAQDNVQKAFDELVSDYGITCAAPSIARDALQSGSKFSSPLYIFYNSWPLEREFTDSNGYTVRYAWHSLDLVAFTSDWYDINGGQYKPTLHDLEMSDTLVELFFSFMSTKGRAVPGLEAVNATAGWPADYLTYVLDGQQQQQEEEEKGAVGAGAGMQQNVKKQECAYFAAVGLAGKQFWWVN